ncbi:phage portal protein [Lacticaseibacillus hulanensis]|uniref:phage portal protein n=1 Tax=Lacticaseibacillus hulanensis TaxID=2493111 RepID=UPI000FD8A25C|nr:phage portal protein [Lacticaseibacillus hulanensis]
MEIGSLKQLLRNTATTQLQFVERAKRSERYYSNQNDITLRNDGESKINNNGADKSKGALRRADYRVSSNFHQILVDQKADYLTSTPPSIDVGDKATNDTVQEVLGDDFAATLQELCVDASNAGIGWLHLWIDQDTSKLRYAAIPPEQILPLYAGDTDRTLLGICRRYAQIDPKTGKQFTCIEYWDDKTVTAYRTDRPNYEDLRELKRFTLYDVSTGQETGDPTSVLEHGLGEVPFIPFRNGKREKPDLPKYKGLIDVYDQVYNGFANDLADVQQVILVLTNYGGQELHEFMDQLQKDKAIKIDSIDPQDKSGVSTLTIDIPVEARQKLLDLTFDNIFVYGEGVNPKQLSTGTSLSGVAIKLLYGQLELKASTTEVWFRQAIARLVRMIMRWAKVPDADNRKIAQTWTRSLISNDTEQADIVAKLAEYTSKESVAKNNPLVEDWQAELKRQKKEADEAAKTKAEHPDPFAPFTTDQPGSKNEPGATVDDNGGKSPDKSQDGVGDE